MPKLNPNKLELISFENKLIAKRNEIIAIATKSIFSENFFNGNYLVNTDIETGKKKFYVITLFSIN